jgi:hypothetical protein
VTRVAYLKADVLALEHGLEDGLDGIAVLHVPQKSLLGKRLYIGWYCFQSDK